MITRAQVAPYIGQRVVVHTYDGMRHHGILQSVNQNGAYLRSIRGGAGMVSGSNLKAAPELLGQLENTGGDVTEAWLPFFFIPWLAMAAFYPWGLWW